MSFSEDSFSNSFKNILLIVKEIGTKKEAITEKLAHLKGQYNEMVKNNTKKLFVFCLDTLFYQYKSLSTELEQIESSRKTVSNRMYCEYYKLYGIVLVYLDDINLSYENKKPLLKPYPVYKDLEPSMEYDMGDIENIFSNLLIAINLLCDLITKNDAKIKMYETEGAGGNPLGFSMTNFVSAMKNENLAIQGQVDLFTNFLSFFLMSQQKQYDRIHRRMIDFLEVCSFSEEDSEKPQLKSLASESVKKAGSEPAATPSLKVVEKRDSNTPGQEAQSVVLVETTPKPSEIIENKTVPEMSFE